MKRTQLLALLFLLPLTGICQLFPAEGSKLNYRLIGFSAPQKNGVNKYKIEVAEGTFYSADSFSRNIMLTFSVKESRTIGEVPAFGKNYTWRATTRGDKENNVLHHFSTLSIPAVDSTQARLRVLHKAEKYKDNYVFLDGNRALYDMEGLPVWYLPDIDGYNTDKSALRDLKLSPEGTITFLYEEHGAYEINYDGKVMWKAPNDGHVGGGPQEFYHHEFTRMPNGHYMILGLDYELWNKELAAAGPENKISPLAHAQVADSDKHKYDRIPYGTLIEYDEKGNVVWSWKSSDYFRNSDIYYHKNRGQPELAAHENSFFFDAPTQTIYIGFRNISRILKVKYPEGTVTGMYGEIYKPDEPQTGNGLYCRQHSVRKSDKGYLYLYNNNSCDPSGLPQLLKLEESESAGGPLKKIWQYDCTTEGVLPGQRVAYPFSVGGNVTELPGGDLFANMSTSYSKVFILSPDKEILWSAIPEKIHPRLKNWEMAYQYRASMITRAQLEQLIWNSEQIK